MKQKYSLSLEERVSKLEGKLSILLWVVTGLYVPAIVGMMAQLK